MSGPAAPPEPADDPALDAGILIAAPVLEFGGWHAVLRLGGAAVLPWRPLWLRARAVGAMAHADVPPDGAPPRQALVRVQRGRAASEAALAAASAALAPGDRLVVTGPNDLGIVGWVRRLGDALGAPLAQSARAKARAAVFTMPTTGARLPTPARARVPLGTDDATMIDVDPGVFSGGGLDAGTALLVAHLQTLSVQPRRVLDAGCGAGHLAIAALRRWPEARALLLDADARACACARRNLAALGLEQRAVVAWWDASEPVPGEPFDLALANPPAHEGQAVSVGPGIQLLRAAGAALAPGGRLVAVANRRLPYEAELDRLGPCEVASEVGGYKILSVIAGGGHA